MECNFFCMWRTTPKHSNDRDTMLYYITLWVSWSGIKKNSKKNQAPLVFEAATAQSSCFCLTFISSLWQNDLNLLAHLLPTSRNISFIEQIGTAQHEYRQIFAHTHASQSWWGKFVCSESVICHQIHRNNLEWVGKKKLAPRNCTKFHTNRHMFILSANIWLRQIPLCRQIQKRNERKNCSKHTTQN